MLIEVQQSHIDQGRPTDPCRCPIALAVTSKIKADDISVGIDGVTLNGTRVRLPIEATHFVVHFDSKIDVQPFTFELDYEPKPEATSDQA